MTNKPFAVFDIDGTLIRWQLYHATIETLINNGHISSTAGQAIAEAKNTWKNRTAVDSFTSFEHTVFRVHGQALTSIHYDHFIEAAIQVFEQHKDQVYTFTRNLIKELRHKQYILIALSGSPQEIIDMLGSYYGFDHTIGSRYEYNQQGYFTGNAQFPTSVGKGKILKRLVQQHQLDWQDSYAIGDSQSDASMLELVTHPIAFNPDLHLFNIAHQHNWPMVIERKNVIYRLNPTDSNYQLQS